jgi:Raf kinase inhibitor-like YbhB/YbcL family protein
MSFIDSKRLRKLAAAAVCATVACAAHAAGMSVSSSAFEDGGTLPARYAGPAACGGENVSLPLAWHALPDHTRSVVVTLTDPNGPKGLGVTHWIAYNIAADTDGLNAGATLAAPVSTGQNMTGATAYRGPCPPVGDVPHHYLLTVTATDLAPGALPPGLDFDALQTRLAGHTLSGSTIVGRYGR